MWMNPTINNPAGGARRLGIASARPTMIIRSSKEERTPDEPSASNNGFEFDALPSANNFTPPPPPKPDVFVSRRCAHSGELVEMAQLLKLAINIHEIETEGIPQWLPGTPTVRDPVKGAGYCGDAAFAFLKHLAQERSVQKPAPAQPQPKKEQPQQMFQSAPAPADSSMGAGLASVYSAQAQQSFMEADALCETADPKDTERSMAMLMEARKPLGETNAIRK